MKYNSEVGKVIFLRRPVLIFSYLFIILSAPYFKKWDRHSGRYYLTETDLAPVQQEANRQGFAITAIHDHFVRNRPNVMYMHIDDRGKVESLSASVKAVFGKVKESKGADPKATKPDSVVNTLNVSLLDSMSGYKGEPSEPERLYYPYKRIDKFKSA